MRRKGRGTRRAENIEIATQQVSVDCKVSPHVEISSTRHRAVSSSTRGGGRKGGCRNRTRQDVRSHDTTSLVRSTRIDCVRGIARRTDACAPNQSERTEPDALGQRALRSTRAAGPTTTFNRSAAAGSERVRLADVDTNAQAAAPGHPQGTAVKPGRARRNGPWTGYSGA